MDKATAFCDFESSGYNPKTQISTGMYSIDLYKESSAPTTRRQQPTTSSSECQ